jgi:hypothetical protein
MLAGIAIGLGAAFRSRRLRMFGQEELLQSIINAAILGSLAAIVLAIDSVSLSALPVQAQGCELPGAVGQAQCSFSRLQSELFELGASASNAAYITGFVSSMTLDLGSIKVSQFSGLAPSVASFGSISQHSYLLSTLAGISIMLLGFASESAMIVLLPSGLLLRSLFITRKLGGAIMAIAISSYVFYPIATLAAFGSQIWPALSDANASYLGFSAKYASIPATDLSKPDSLRLMIADLSNGDFAGEVATLQKSSAIALASAASASLVYPLIALAISLAAFFELYRFLGSEISFDLFDMA